MKFGAGASDLCLRNQEVAVYYDQNKLPMGLDIEKVREFVLGTMRSVLLHKEVSIA